MYSGVTFVYITTSLFVFEADLMGPVFEIGPNILWQTNITFKVTTSCPHALVALNNVFFGYLIHVIVFDLFRHSTWLSISKTQLALQNFQTTLTKLRGHDIFILSVSSHFYGGSKYYTIKSSINQNNQLVFIYDNCL